MYSSPDWEKVRRETGTGLEMLIAITGSGGRGIRDLGLVGVGVGDGEDRSLLFAQQLVLPLRRVEIFDRA